MAVTADLFVKALDHHYHFVPYLADVMPGKIIATIAPYIPFLASLLKSISLDIIVFAILLIIFFKPTHRFVDSKRFGNFWMRVSKRKWQCITSFYGRLLGIVLEDDAIRAINLMKQQLNDKSVVTFPSGSRTEQAFIDDLKANIVRSNKIHILSISGNTMFNDERERFVPETLFAQSYKKDVKFKFLSPDAPIWSERARWYVEKLRRSGASSPLTIDEYKEECGNIAMRLCGCWPKSVSYYSREPFYRMHIFDDCLFISLYGFYDDRKIFSWEEGHLTEVLKINRTPGNPLYDIFCSIFAQQA